MSLFSVLSSTIDKYGVEARIRKGTNSLCTYYSESMSIGISTNITTNGSQPTISGTGNKPNKAPGGSTTIEGSYNQNESNRTTYATIGSLTDYNNQTLKLTSETNDLIGGDFEGSLTIDHRLFSESGRKNITKDFKELPANTLIIKDNIYKVACESCFVSKEMKEMVKNSDIEGKAKLPPEYQLALDEFVTKVEKEVGIDIDNMTNEERIVALNRLKNSDGPLTDLEMRYRDALWATAKDEPEWQQFRSSQITQIANTVINDPSYIETKNKWEVFSDFSKKSYVESLVEKQQGLFGDNRDINIVMEIDNNKNLSGSYNSKLNTLSINPLSQDYKNFYGTVNTVVHEYGGHGYQDLIVENKSNYLLINPQFSNMVNFFELNYNSKVRAKQNTTYESFLGYGIYYNKPTEGDAFNMGDSVQLKLK